MRKATTTLVILISVFVSAQRPTTVVNQNWVGNQWNDVSRMINTYDGNNYLTESRQQQWVNPGLWQNHVLVQYTNNGTGNVVEYISQNWDLQSSTWQRYFKGNHLYDNNRLSETINSSWLNNAWVNQFKTTYFYNASGLLISEISQTWDNTASLWENTSRQMNTYLPNGLLESTTSQFWNDDNNQWTNTYLETYSYVNDKVSTIVYQIWMQTLWIDQMRDTYTYNANGDEYTVKEENWELETSQWENNSLTTNTYDANRNLVEELLQTWEDEAWINESRMVLTYSGSTGVDDGESTSVGLYPNPVKDHLVVQFPKASNVASYQVIALSGKTILKDRLQGVTTRINLTTLPDGVYLLKIEDNNHSTVKKFIKR